MSLSRTIKIKRIPVNTKPTKIKSGRGHSLNSGKQKVATVLTDNS